MKNILTFIFLIAASQFPKAQASMASAGTTESVNTDTVLIIAIWVLIGICILVLIVTIYALSALKLVLKGDMSTAAEETVVVTEKNVQGWNVLVPIRQETGLSKRLKWAYFIIPGILLAGLIVYFSLHTNGNNWISNKVNGLFVSNAKPDYIHNPAVIDSGKVIFSMNCVPCHAADGGGGIGPNLTDQYWIHGGSIKDITSTITNGVPAKGMITWSPILDSVQISDVGYYILSLQGTKPAKPKAPQGDLYVPGKNNGGHSVLAATKSGSGKNQ